MAPPRTLASSPWPRSAGDAVTMPTGTVVAWDGEAGREVGEFDHETAPPAIRADDSLAVAGCAGRGPCRVRASGEVVRQGAPKDADMLPTTDRAQACAVGGVNDECSWLNAPDGRGLALYRHSASSAEYADSGRIAATQRSIARLGPRGAEMWSAEIAHDLRWGLYGPIVDRSGRMYLQGEDESLIGLDPRGAQVLALRLGEAPGAVFPAGEGVFAVVVDEALRFIGDGR